MIKCLLNIYFILYIVSWYGLSYALIFNLYVWWQGSGDARALTQAWRSEDSRVQGTAVYSQLSGL